MTVCSIVLAAGRGSRMKGYKGNKALLPLIPEDGPYRGRLPMLLHILRRLPPGPKAVVVHHGKEDVMAATEGLGLTYVEQPELDGTGGALLAATDFLKAQRSHAVLITMGDVPFVRPATYEELLEGLEEHALVVLGFMPKSPRQYGILETQGDQVKKIIEWKYWMGFPEERRASLRICNAGIYAARRDVLLQYLPVLATRPHIITKEVDGRPREVTEYFLTDLVEWMHEDGIPTGYRLAGDEAEVMGVDDPEALRKAQDIYAAAVLHS